MASRHVRRVDQLDAMILDDELLSIVITQYRRAFTHFPNTVLARFCPEIDVFFRLLFKSLPLHILGSTFGQNLFQLQYRDYMTHQLAGAQKLQFLAIISVALPWFWERLLRKIIMLLPRSEATRKAFDLSYSLESKCHTLYNILTFINFCVFLQRSSFPTVIERILGIRPMYTVRQDIRSVHSDNVTRELLWYGVSEFLQFTLPLINVHKIRGFVKRTCLPMSYRNHYKNLILENNNCFICGDTPNFPHTIGCSHVFCYYCIASMLLADPSYLCFDCDVKANGLSSLKPLALNKM